MKAALFWALLSLGSLWGGLALWVQFAQTRTFALLGLAALVLVVAALRLLTGWGWLALAFVALLLGGWYVTLRPEQNRDWAADVAHIVTGQVTGDIVQVENIRAFRWTTPEVSTGGWTSRRVDLTQLTGADMITSSWGNPKIAHLLVSFRFADQSPITFSVEIRRETGEKFSALGGFFRQFELSLIAAEEADIVQWRAVPRAEDVQLYPLALTPTQLRELFLSYIDLGNELNAAPRWYNTVTANCVTVVWRLADVLGLRLPVDQSLLLPGLLPEFLHRLGGLEWQGDMAELRARAGISTRARTLPPGTDFSSWIREGQAL